MPAPPATHGYEDLHREAQTSVDDDVVVEVASLVDLVRIAQAGEEPGRAYRRCAARSNSPTRPQTRLLVPPDAPAFAPQRILEVLARHDVLCVVIGGYAAVLAGAQIVNA